MIIYIFRIKLRIRWYIKINWLEEIINMFIIKDYWGFCWNHKWINRD